MQASTVLRHARRSRDLTVSALAVAAGTSQPTLTAYETGRMTPGVGTFSRLVEAAGYAVDARLVRRHRDGPTPALTRGEELAQVLDLAAQFPAEHARHLGYPVFGERR